MVMGVKCFHKYLYGREFELVTDHKPLLGIFTRDKQISHVLSPRLLRWTVFLAANLYQLLHWPGKALGHADALSHCPLPTMAEDVAPASEILCINELPMVLVSAFDVAAQAIKDHTLFQVLDWVMRGWLKGPFEPEFQSYSCRQHKLSVHKGSFSGEVGLQCPPD